SELVVAFGRAGPRRVERAGARERRLAAHPDVDTAARDQLVVHREASVEIVLHSVIRSPAASVRRSVVASYHRPAVSGSGGSRDRARSLGERDFRDEAELVALCGAEAREPCSVLAARDFLSEVLVALEPQVEVPRDD